MERMKLTRRGSLTTHGCSEVAWGLQHPYVPGRAQLRALGSAPAGLPLARHSTPTCPPSTPACCHHCRGCKTSEGLPPNGRSLVLHPLCSPQTLGGMQQGPPCPQSSQHSCSHGSACPSAELRQA